MRIVVVGATGNVGTAVLARLKQVGPALQIAGVARRIPAQDVAPYAGVDWHSVDVGASTATAQLATVFAGADAVIHLAWALQPNRDVPTMRRVNVDGTAATLRAVALEGVRQVVVASSVGAYSFGPKRWRVDESWPTGATPSSSYGRHKAANERALDAFERANPATIVTRLRPGLIFQQQAGREIAGLFLGRHFPTRWIGLIKPTVLPLPTGLIFQAVHARDVADAFWRAIDRRAGGAFNIAAEPVLTPQLIAEVIGATRTVPFRLAVLRAIVDVSWRLHLQATDAGWLDIAQTVPIMSTARARDILGWQQTVTATEALAEIVAGVTARTSLPGSGPLGG